MGLHENYYSNTSSSWEVYSLTDIPRERYMLEQPSLVELLNCVIRILKMEVEDNLPLPALSEQSELMEAFHIQQV